MIWTQNIYERVEIVKEMKNRVVKMYKVSAFVSSFIK